METKKSILSVFFIYPRKAFHIRELAKVVHQSHTSVRKHLHLLVKEGYLRLKKDTPYNKYLADISSARYTTAKLGFNLESIQESGLLAYLEPELEHPVMVLFGSYAKGWDDEQSDIDIAVISNAKPSINLEKYEQRLHRKISIHSFTKKEWNLARKKNPELVNSICNGLVLAGQLEVLS